MSDKLNFVYNKPRMLPVILLLDASGSMSIDGNIEVLNNAVNEMLDDFKKAQSTIADISVAVITFGRNGAELLQPLASVEDLVAVKLKAEGGTPLGSAINIAKELIEDRGIISGRAYRPTVIVVSDGEPNDDWEDALENFVKEGRSSKCYRMALSIGAEEGTPAFQVLEQFTGNVERVFNAKDARGISRFFRYVTMSTTSRVQSTNPNVIPEITPAYLEDEDDDYRPF